METTLLENTHLPVLLTETVAALAVSPSGIYLDGTFGRGGHTRAILARLDADGRVVGLDRDPQAADAAAVLQKSDARFTFVSARFSQMNEVLAGLSIAEVNGILLDLGTSSPQIDDAARGFSFRFDGPLDMRMNPSEGESAAQFLARADESLIAKVLKNYGEERYAPQIARAIVTARGERPVSRTRQLVEIVEKCLGGRVKGDWQQNPATRTFQALRIKVNDELGELRTFLPKAVARLKAGGRLAVISFHSLEDRMVKQFFASLSRPFADTSLMRLPIAEKRLPQPLLKNVSRAIRADDDETAKNPRARSAVLRVAERGDVPADSPEFVRQMNAVTKENAGD